MRTRSSRASGTEPVLSATDFRRYLLKQAVQIAPGDVESLLARRGAIEAKINQGCGGHDLLQAQLRFALELVSDHADGSAPQIPFHTVGLLTAALLYFMNPVDVIPDLIPRIGTSDDALVVELAFELGARGVERYAHWKGIPASSVLVGKRPMAEQPVRPGRAPVTRPRVRRSR
jgi:uncharacterized membrane protein YkvA (DUF1232 family)